MLRMQHHDMIHEHVQDIVYIEVAYRSNTIKMDSNYLRLT